MRGKVSDGQSGTTWGFLDAVAAFTLQGTVEWDYPHDI